MASILSGKPDSAKGRVAARRQSVTFEQFLIKLNGGGSIAHAKN
ncbi:MAG TPA: hypothetical protein VGN39_08955 [Terriglobales bacterium]|nr:hypothetical protein [Terriglobales bacterium]